MLPLYQEIAWRDPLTIAAHFSSHPWSLFLDSARCMNPIARYSYLAIDPFMTLTSKNGVLEIKGECEIENKNPDPFQALQQYVSCFPMEFHPHLPLFQGGVAGYLGYDLYQHLEKITSTQCDDMEFPDMAVGFYDLIVAFDNEEKRAWIFSSGYPHQDFKFRNEHASTRIENILKQLALISEFPAASNQINKIHPIHANFTQETYCLAVQKVIDYIAAGDIFEANISQRFQTTLPENLSAFDLYQRLRKRNPAPFAAYLHTEKAIIVSASPERFLKLQGRQVETRPIKGTRPRGQTKQQDAQFAQELLASEKDRAENIMIVDLMRNDLSRVCEDHSVQVPELCELESYATVHHLVSTITGTLAENYDAIDLLRASFPGGSITGAPKIRAMEIIAEIEPTRRGPYCGSIISLGFNGDLDASILIRSFCIRDQQVTFQVGGAVVLDSDPLAEYEETLVKARALLDVIIPNEEIH